MCVPLPRPAEERWWGAANVDWEAGAMAEGGGSGARRLRKGKRTGVGAAAAAAAGRIGPDGRRGTWKQIRR